EGEVVKAEGGRAEKTEVDDGAALAFAAVAPFAARTADRFIFRERTVRHGSQRSVQIVEGAAVGVAAVAARTPGAADGPVTGESAVGYGEGRVAPVPDGAACPVPSADAGRALAADRLAVAELAAADRQGPAGEAVGDGASLPRRTADCGNTQPAPAHDPVVGEGAAVHGHRAALVEDGAAAGILPRRREGLVVIQGDLRQDQGAPDVVDGPAPGFRPGQADGLVVP